MIPDFARADWDGLRSGVLMAPLLEAMRDTKDVDAAWAAWYSVFTTTVHRFVPIHLIMIRKGNKFWMTTELRRLVRRKIACLRPRAAVELTHLGISIDKQGIDV